MRVSGSDGETGWLGEWGRSHFGRGIGVCEGKEGVKGEQEESAAHQANNAKHRQARAEVHAACVAVHVGPAAASSRSEKASAARGSGWGEVRVGDTVSAHAWCCVCSDSGDVRALCGGATGGHRETRAGTKQRKVSPASSATDRTMNSTRARGICAVRGGSTHRVFPRLSALLLALTLCSHGSKFGQLG